MNILVLGAGGREHALSWKLAQSPLVERIFVAPGNAGTEQVGINLDLSVNDFEGIKSALKEHSIELLVVGPEDPLCHGIVDFLKTDPELTGLKIIGPDKAGAQLEGSKEFAKKFMKKYSIPTAAYESFESGQYDDACSFLESLKPPYVLKADGLAAGKGVVILDDLNRAKEELKEMLDGKFGAASSKVVIEEFLDGIEMSVFAITDGKNYVLLPEAKDYKRIGEGDTGLNTGGMGAISPVPFAQGAFLKKVEEQVVKPTIDGIQAEGFDYCGFVFFGLINVKGNPYVIEYNVRMGDPETEVVMPRIASDLVPVLLGAAEGKLGDMKIEFDMRSACTVMMVSGGYPENYEKGKVMSGLDRPSDSILFHAGTKSDDGQVLTNGGRVISVTSYGEDFRKALETSYQTAAGISFEGSYYRKDLGFDL